MKIILRDNVETLGQAGEIVTVKDGYARNYLIPRNLAYPATKSNLRAWEDEKRRFTVRTTREMKEAEAVKTVLEALSIEIAMQVGEEGRLFGSVTNRMVAEELAAKGFDIDHRYIIIDEPIRSLGVHDVMVRLVHGVTATVPVTVAAENRPEGEAAVAQAAPPIAEEAPEPVAEDSPEEE